MYFFIITKLFCQCLQYSIVCDKQADCEDGSDELPGLCTVDPRVDEGLICDDGFICDEHDTTTIPEDCTILSIEAGQCRYGVLIDR